MSSFGLKVTWSVQTLEIKAISNRKVESEIAIGSDSDSDSESSVQSLS